MLNNLKNFIKSLGTGGARWQFTLCTVLLSFILIYLYTHGVFLNKNTSGNSKIGKEHIQLNIEQLGTIKIYLDNYLDDTSQDSGRKAIIVEKRKERDEGIINLLNTYYDGKLDSIQLTRIKTILSKTNSKDVFQILSQTRLLVRSPFWLSGELVYFEAFFWSLFGVLVSLIYYVSLANSSRNESTEEEGIGTFNQKEVPGQIAKMFYAPACTIVLVLGYHFISGVNENMVDISVNKGLLVFSFICGFYSGRVMTFLDRLKELLLPISGDGGRTNKPEIIYGDVDVSLKIDETISDKLLVADIIDAGFKAAEVKLISNNLGADPINLLNSSEEDNCIFSGNKIPAGKYKLIASLAHKADNNTIINLQGEKEVNISGNKLEVDLELNLLESVG